MGTDQRTKTSQSLSLSTLAVLLLAVLTLGSACRTAISTGKDSVPVPFLKNSPGECYYLDEFMPVPDSLVAGKNGAMDLRYYTYNSANYKDWRTKQVMLSFYSKNGRCWSLFEEFYLAE